MKKSISILLFTLLCSFLMNGQICITNSSVEIGDCNPDGTYTAFLSFEHSPDIDTVSIYFDGAYFGNHPSINQPIVLSPLSGDSEVHIIEIESIDILGCQDSIIYEAPFCQEECLSIINELSSFCVDSTLNLVIDYTFRNPETEVHIFVNDQYITNGQTGTGITETIAVPTSSNSVYEVVIRDAEFLTCGDTSFIQVSPCMENCITSYDYRIDCQDDGANDVTLYFPALVDFVDIYYDGNYTGVSGGDSISQYTIFGRVDDTLGMNHDATFSYQSPLCEPLACDTDLSFFNVTTTCLADSMYQMNVSFSSNEPLRDYMITTNSNFTNSSNPTNVYGPFTGSPNQGNFIGAQIILSTFYTGTFYIYELDNPICNTEFEVNIDCDSIPGCEVEILSVTPDCNPEGLFLNIAYNAVNVLTEYHLFLNGQYVQNVSEGTGMSVSIFANDIGSIDNYQIEIRDAEFLTCSDTYNLGEFECIVQDSCEFAYLGVGETACNNDGTYNAAVLFEIENYASTMVTVYVNNNFFGNLPYNGDGLDLNNISSIPGTNMGIVKICSTLDDSCCMEVEYIAPTCPVDEPCDIFNIQVLSTCLNSQEFTSIVTFDYTGIEGDTVKIYDYLYNLIGYYDVTEQPILINNFYVPGQQNFFGVVIENPLNTNCISESFIEEVECEIESCQILSAEDSDPVCNNDGTYDLTVFYDLINPTSDFLLVSVNGVLYDSILITSNASFTLSNISSLPNDNFDIISFCVDGSADCCFDLDVLHPNCETAPPCSITNLEAIPICSFDGSTFDFVITYEYEGSSGQVETFLNGESYGVSNAAFPLIELGPFTNFNSPDFDIVLRDIDTSIECSDSTFVSAPLCEDGTPCSLDFVQNDSTTCNSDGTYNVNIFYGNGGSDPNSVVEVYVNNEFLDVFSDNGILNLNNLISNPNADFDLITICIPTNPDCCIAYEYLTPDCSTTDCIITDLTYDFECDGDSIYYAGISYLSESTSGTVQVFANGNSLGFFNTANQPHQIGPLFSGFGYNIKVVDAQIDNCFGEVEFNFDGCSDNQDPCAIQYIEIDSLVCNNDGTFNMTAYYGFENADNASIDVFLNDQFYDFYTIGSQVTLTNIPLSITNEVKTIKICINDNPDCCMTVEYLQPSCETTQDSCSLEINNVEYLCNGEADEQIYFQVDVSNFDMNELDVYVNGAFMESGVLTNSVIEVGPVMQNNDGYYVIKVIDTANELCFAEYELFQAFCPTDCELDSFIVEWDCDAAGSVSFFLYFDSLNTSGEIILTGNGTSYGVFDASQQPIALGPMDPSSHDTWEFVISDALNDDCQAIYEVGAVECFDPNDCFIGDIEVETECDSNGMVYFNFYYDAQNTSGEVIIRGNGINYGFYGANQLPAVLGPLDPNLNDIWEFTILDSVNDSCQRTIVLGDVECFNSNICSISDIEVETECDSLDMTYFYLYFDAQNTSGEVNVKGNGTDYGFFGTAQQPIVLGPLDPNLHDDWEFVIIDSQDDACQSDIVLGPVDCNDINEVMPCLIEGIEVYDIECIGNNEYSMSLDFEVTANLNVPFTFYINGELMNNALSSTLPLNLFGIVANDSSEVEVIEICLDGTADVCCVEFTFDKPACLSNSVDATLIDDVILSPNPTRDMINIAHIPNEVIGIHIIDNLGRSVEQRTASESMQFDVSNYTEGIYMVQFYTADNRVMSKRFIKMN